MTGDKTAYCQCLGRAGELAAGGRRAGRGARTGWAMVSWKL